MKSLLLLASCFFLLTAFKPSEQDKKCPELSVSSNGRFLTAAGEPFFWLGDTGWMLLEKLNRQETEKYLDNRKDKGFNVIQIMLLHSLSSTDAAGDSALICRNVAVPNLSRADNGVGGQKSGYWENLDFVADLAAKKGLYLALVPVWGSNVRAGLVTQGQAEAYARFLAGRYGGRSNIIWLNGGDVRGDDSIRIWNTIGNTLRKLAPTQLITFHPFGRTQSSQRFHNENWLDFNMFQSGHRSYEQDTSPKDLRYGEDNWKYLASDYQLTPVKPTLDGEPSYEGIPHGLHDTLQPRWTDNDIRRYAYWSAFSGGCGFTYGHNSVMQFHKKGEKTGAYGARQPWEEAIDAPGACQMVYLKKLMMNYHFNQLIPDQTMLQDPGQRYNHLVALRGTKCLLVYTWNGRNIRVKPDLFKGSEWEAEWYSPRNGEVVRAGIATPGHLKGFDPPGNPGDGNDWVLILERK